MEAGIFYWILIVGAAHNKNQWKPVTLLHSAPAENNPWNILQPRLYLKFNSSRSPPEKLPSKKERACLPTRIKFRGFCLLLNFQWGGCLLGHFLRPYQGEFLFWGELPVSCDWWVFPPKKCFGKVSFFCRTRVIYSFSNFFYLTVAVIPAVERSKHPKIAWNSTWRLLRGRFLLSADTGFHVSTLRQMVTLQ